MVIKGAAKLAAAMACAVIVGAAAAYVSEQRFGRLVWVSADGTWEDRTAAQPEPIFDPARDDCLPTGNAKYVLLDAPPFVIRFPRNGEEDFVARRPTMLALRSTTRVRDGLELGLMVDGNFAEIDIPRSRLWAVRFCGTACPATNPILVPEDNDVRAYVAPCAWQDREENARLVFGAAFASMQGGDASRAKVLFEFGLRLDPTSPLAWFYNAEADRGVWGEDFDLSELSKRWYRRALEIGLPAELEAIAEARIERN
ncbi:hypothetical protein LB533_03545 [Mesorhizobium sp. BR1-1-13]|uniref:hypothetical protein n=1 Tax=Mesorhizobium sp. BR1-1-13 TaxID=2876656 RepID=UPI001CD0EE54|nr:hypothetical protein [Mesorhizobium sp. BR1-1-13]MBZ9940174.1 hypothetical protein [Mesorhizobium sp. BR1-1-13]